MADPRRYYIDAMLTEAGELNVAKLHIEPAISGDWIKWADFEDYKAAQRRNRNEATVIRLGEEIAYLRAELSAIRTETVKQIEAAIPPVEAYIAKLEAEVERLTKAGDAMHEEATNILHPYKLRLAMEAWNAAKEGKSV